MNPITPVIAFVWGEEPAATAGDNAFECKPRHRRRHKPQVAAFIAARGPQASGAVRSPRR